MEGWGSRITRWRVDIHQVVMAAAEAFVVHKKIGSKQHATVVAVVETIASWVNPTLWYVLSGHAVQPDNIVRSLLRRPIFDKILTFPPSLSLPSLSADILRQSFCLFMWVSLSSFWVSPPVPVRDHLSKLLNSFHVLQRRHQHLNRAIYCRNSQAGFVSVLHHASSSLGKRQTS